MLKHWLYLYLFFLLKSFIFSDVGTVYNPQTMMFGARYMSLGGTSVLDSDVSGLLINPAAASGIEDLSLSVSNQKILNEFSYFLVNAAKTYNFTFKQNDQDLVLPISFGTSYGRVDLADIPRTVVYLDYPYQTGSFSSGFDVLSASFSTSIYNRFSFDKLSAGLSAKRVSLFTGSSSASTFGVDFGLIGSFYFSRYGINKIDTGVTVHNLLSPPIKLDTNNEALLPFRINFGSQIDFFDSRGSLFLTNNELGTSIGGEGGVLDNLILRGSSTVYQGNIRDYNIGLGILFMNMPIFPPNYNVKFRIDINYNQPLSVLSDEPSYMITFTSLGKSKPKKPLILEPSSKIIRISSNIFDLSGIGPKNSIIQIYNNNDFYRSIRSDSYGNWSIENMRVNEGENVIFIKSFNMLSDFSSRSNEITVFSDTLNPVIDYKLSIIDNKQFRIILLSDEKLKNYVFKLNGNNIEFNLIDDENDTYFNLNGFNYESIVPFPIDMIPGQGIPMKMSQLSGSFSDEVGNNIDNISKELIVSLNSPFDKHVHYESNIFIIGQYSQFIKDIYINGIQSSFDDLGQFFSSIELENGKNSIEFKIQLNSGDFLNYYSRILKLVNYNDISAKTKGRREIQFLSTLNVLFGDSDGSFYPDRLVTRQYITKLLVKALDLDVPIEITEDLFVDVSFDHPYAKFISTAINAGYAYAFPDGFFRPNQNLTLSEIIVFLSEAGLIQYEEVENGGNTVTRAELAEFLAYTSELELLIEDLINWESGYR